MSFGAQRAIRAALSVCVDWVRGDADYSNSPPQGLAKPNPFLDASFKLALSLSSTGPVPYWVDSRGINRSDSIWVAYLNGTCLVTAPVALGPPTLADLSSDLAAAIKSHKPGLRQFNHVSSKDELWIVHHQFVSEGDKAVSILVSYRWSGSQPTVGAFMASVRLQ
jgi:hypothetical protein